MVTFDARKWWLFVLRGMVAIAFGVLTWTLPAMALLTLVILFGAYAFVDGASSFAAAIDRTDSEPPRWLLAINGIVSMGAGLVAVLAPGVTAFALLMIIAVRSIATGMLEISAAVRLRKEIRGEWLLASSGALSIAFGVLLFMFPGQGALGVLVLIGSYAVVLGVLLIGLGLRMRTIRRRIFNEPADLSFGDQYAGSH